jgi:hypothetical protein
VQAASAAINIRRRRSALETRTRRRPAEADIHPHKAIACDTPRPHTDRLHHLDPRRLEAAHPQRGSAGPTDCSNLPGPKRLCHKAMLDEVGTIARSESGAADYDLAR